MSRLIDKVNYYRKVALDNGALNRYFKSEILNTQEMAKQIYHTSHLEGNTVTLGCTEAYLTKVVGVHELANKYSKGEVYEIDGLNRAIRFAYQSDTQWLTEEFIKQIHYYVYKPTEERKYGNYAGEYRMAECQTRRKDGSIKDYLDYHLIEDYMEELVFRFNSSTHGIKSACRLKLDYIHIHPFADGNGRVSRILLNWALIKAGYIPITIKHTEKRQYIDTLDYYGTTGDSSKFEEFVCNKLIEAYKNII